MERALTHYIRALRTAGAAVSPSEAIDAARALAVVGYADRPTMKDALSVVLAKTEEEKALHDRLFDLYFSRATPPDEAMAREAAEAEAEGAESAEGKADGDGEGEGPVPAQDPAAAVEALMEMAAAPGGQRLAYALERAAAAVGADQIRFASQGSYFARRMLEALGVQALETELMAQLETRTDEARARAQAMMDARAALMREARAVVDQRFAVFGAAATENFMNDAVANRAIERLGQRDLERMKAVVARMARRLAIRHSRRRKVRNRGHLDVRRTLRANAGNDWVPFEVVWKKKHRDRPKIVAVCDVSGSVASYVRFLLLFLWALNEKVADLGAFAFSNTLADVSHLLDRHSYEGAAGHILDVLGAGGTDYGQALKDLRDHHWELIDRRTTVLVLGDGRSNHTNPRLDIFAEMADRAKRVVWLCPEPPGRWGSGDSEILRYQPFCTLLTHCATALDLEQALDDILLAYD